MDFWSMITQSRPNRFRNANFATWSIWNIWDINSSPFPYVPHINTIYHILSNLNSGRIQMCFPTIVQAKCSPNLYEQCITICLTRKRNQQIAKRDRTVPEILRNCSESHCSDRCGASGNLSSRLREPGGPNLEGQC